MMGIRWGTSTTQPHKPHSTDVSDEEKAMAAPYLTQHAESLDHHGSSIGQ